MQAWRWFFFRRNDHLAHGSLVVAVWNTGVSVPLITWTCGLETFPCQYFLRNIFPTTLRPLFRKLSSLHSSFYSFEVQLKFKQSSSGLKYPPLHNSDAAVSDTWYPENEASNAFCHVPFRSIRSPFARDSHSACSLDGVRNEKNSCRQDWQIVGSVLEGRAFKRQPLKGINKLTRMGSVSTIEVYWCPKSWLAMRIT